MDTSKNIKFEKLLNKMEFIPLISLIYWNEQEFLDKNLKEVDVTSGQVSCLMKIYEYDLKVHEEKLCQNDLVNMLKMSKGTISNSLKKLEEKGYIKREVIPNNRRKYEISLTPKGETIVPKVIEIDKKWEKEMKCSYIDNELKEKLRKIVIRTLEINDKL